MGRIIHHYETKGPAEIRPKADYLLKDCLRKSYERNIEFNLPYKLPMNTLPLLRYVIAAQGQLQSMIVDHLFHSVWRDRINIEDEEILRDYLLRVIGERDIDEMMENSTSADVRKLIKLNTQRALGFGVFGVPTIVAEDKELFWGDDSLEYLRRYLRGEDHFNEKVYKRYLEITSR